MTTERWHFKEDVPDEEREILKEYVEDRELKNFDTESLKLQDLGSRLGIKNLEGSVEPEYSSLEEIKMHLQKKFEELKAQEEIIKLLADSYDHTHNVFREKWDTLYGILRTKKPLDQKSREEIQKMQREIDMVWASGDRAWTAYQAEIKNYQKIFDASIEAWDRLIALESVDTIRNKNGVGSVDFSNN